MKSGTKKNKNSQNLLIKGDNLEVLKHLSNAYYEKIKMIYIDPPYNTGSDGFVYQDDRKFTVEELSRLAGIDEEKAKRILEFTQSKSNSHSAWLTFMYPRLYIAKQLLKDDGVIFVSIDDNEVAQLRLLMDEVFGEENFVGEFVINSTPNARDYGHIGKMHEYAIFYSKNLQYTQTNLLQEKEKKFKYNDEIGGFNIHPLYNSNVAFTPENRPNLFYPFYLNPNKKENGFFEISLENPRRFIFSKWTLREGWDNPNIFQICKLRSSGSEISKLQEVGRGLRLPVNQYGNRVKDEQFFLNYFVDFTENDFVERLVNEINEKSGAISRDANPEKFDERMIKQIVEQYKLDEDDLIDELVDKKIIRASHKFLEGGLEYIKINYPLIFEGIDSNKVRKATDKKKKVKIRVEKYAELKSLWEKLNEKVVLEYKIEDESKFQELFIDFLQNNTPFEMEGVREKTAQIDIENNQAVFRQEEVIYDNQITQISIMQYDEFLKQLSESLYINLKTLHQCFIKTKIDINKYLNQTTLRLLKQKFDNYLMYRALSKFQIAYQKVANTIHPTKFTNIDGSIKKEVDAYDIGRYDSDEKVADNYFLEDLFYDSDSEKDNIITKIKDVVVFSKIPKNSIKIPVAGGKSYSPDFAYVLNFADGKKKLYFIVETKNADEESLRNEEIQKIKHAEKFFDNTIQIKFQTQFSNDKMVSLIQKVYNL